MKLRIANRKISVPEYQMMRKTTGWAMLDNDVVERALENDLFSVCVFDEDKLVGIGRVVGDGFIYFYIQDIIVIPQYQKNGIGRIIMENIEAYLSRATHNNSFVGLMAAVDVENFYKRFGYQIRPANKPGMFKMVKK